MLNYLEAAAQRGFEHAKPFGHDRAQHAGALAPAGDEDLQRRIFVERREWHLAKARDLLADRIADKDRLVPVPGLETIDLVVGRANCRSLGREQPVDPAHDGILLVKDGRNPQRTRRKQRRESGITAEADDRVGRMLSVEALGLGPPARHCAKRP